MANSDPTAVPGHASPRPGSDGVVLDQPFDMNGLYAMRAALVAHGSELGVRGEALEHLVMVASELANNAVRHGGGRGRLRLWRSSGSVFCEVADAGPGIADPHVGTRRVGATALGGRGLWICRQLSDTMTIASGSPGAVVTVSIAVSDGARPAGTGSATVEPATTTD